MKIPGTPYEVVGHIPLSAPKKDGSRHQQATLQERWLHGVMPFKFRTRQDKTIATLEIRRQSDRAAELHLLTTRRDGMKPSELPIAAYLTACTLLKETVDDEMEQVKLDNGIVRESTKALQLLRSGNDSLEEAKLALPKGRPNIRQDVAARPEIPSLDEAARQLADYYVAIRDIDTTLLPNRVAVGTAVARYTETATCGRSAAEVVHEHSRKLTGHQTAHWMSHMNMNHAWAELRHDHSRNDNDAIIDRWADGPAVLRKHSHHARKFVALPAYSLDRETGPAAADKIDAIEAELRSDARFARMLELQTKRLTRSPPPPLKMSDTNSILSKEFGQRATDALRAAAPLRLELAAVGAAKSLGASTREAQRLAPVILQSLDSQLAEIKPASPR